MSFYEEMVAKYGLVERKRKKNCKKLKTVIKPKELCCSPTGQRMLDGGTYMGYFTIGIYENVEPTQKTFGVIYEQLQFEYADGITHSFLLNDFGPCVYFAYIYIDGKPIHVKVGKAGGANGWYGRVGTYAGQDATNRRIIEIMKKDYSFDTPIHIYAIRTPNKKVLETTPLGDEYYIETSTAPGLETSYIKTCESEGAALIFCNQKK